MSVVSSKAKSNPKLKWFSEARYGMFIHFGIYAQLGRGEWVQYKENIPVSEYEKLTQTFNPSKFDADEWVSLAENAGCRYICFTTKHHDGFCMFDSKLTDYKITNTPFKRDLTGELIDACQRRKMRICLYYSQPDWRHPNYVHLPGAFKDLNHPPECNKPDWNKYLKYYHGQVEELCANYGEINGIWFDGSHKSEKMWQGKKIYKLIKRLQPGAIVNDRAQFGDMYTPERTLPEDLSDYLFEACESIDKNSWGYSKSSPKASINNLLENLVRVTSAGGNFLLNVGPLPDGTIAQNQAERMLAVGAWLKMNGQAVYGTKKGNIETGSDDILASRKNHKLYIHLCRWPDFDQLDIPGIVQLPLHARLLVGNVELWCKQNPQSGLTIGNLPMLPPSPSVNVIELAFDQEPEETQKLKKVEISEVINLKSKGTSICSVSKASVKGRGVKGKRLNIKSSGKKNPSHVVSDWGNVNQKLFWTVNAPVACNYELNVQVSCPKPFHGSSYLISSGKQKLMGKISPTSRDDAYKWQSVGMLKLKHGKNVICMQPLDMPYGYIFAKVGAISLNQAEQLDVSCVENGVK